MSFVYHRNIDSRNGVVGYVVGFYGPKGEWHTESFHHDRLNAASWASYLNGGSSRGWCGDEQQEATK
jgi:hypothetical protein